VVIKLESQPTTKEEVTVTATRTNTRVQDEPLRVEVLGREEVEEKLQMTPGDIAMLLNETAGLRVQVTSPSLGAASVRVQGLRGRYTQLLADGLPLYGGQSGSIGLLQIPPMDLGQVEIIKGVASSLSDRRARWRRESVSSAADKRSTGATRRPKEAPTRCCGCRGRCAVTGATRCSLAPIGRDDTTSMTTAGQTSRMCGADRFGRDCSGMTNRDGRSS
jgi:hypothetical protein